METRIAEELMSANDPTEAIFAPSHWASPFTTTSNEQATTIEQVDIKGVTNVSSRLNAKYEYWLGFPSLMSGFAHNIVSTHVYCGA